MQERTWLLDVDALDDVDAPTTLRFSSGAYIDSSANYYDARLKQPALFTVKAFGSIIAGASRSGYGEAVLINSDGELNYLADYAADGRAAILRLLDESGAITQVLRGTVGGLTFEPAQISVKLRDPLQVLQNPHPLSVYGGTNALPNGVDGAASDIKGKNQPRVLGRVRNAAPVLVNTARYIYQYHDGADADATAVYDRGISLTRGANYTDMADMQANAPLPGQYRVYQGYFRVGSVPTGTITVDADSTVTALGDVFAMLASQAGVTVNSSDIAAINAVGDVGIYLTGPRNTSDLFDLLANSAGGYWTFDGLGVIRLRQLLAPASPTLSLLDYQIVSITRKATGAGPSGLPVWSVTLNADRVETTQTDLAASVSAASVARLSAQTRQAIATTPSTLTRHPLAEQVTFDTALRNLSDGQTQATRIAALFAGRRDTVQVVARIDPANTSLITIGTVLTLITSKLGYEMGRDMIVVGFILDARLSRATLDLWG